MKVSVIVPVYNVGGYIAHCAERLMQQTLEDVEYIFIDDATPDRSIDILQAVIQKYPQRKQNIRIIEHHKNKGLPTARNTGLAAATGEYIYHCDSDDFTEPEMLETLYNTACRENADIVWCDYYDTFYQKEVYKKQPAYSGPLEALRGMLTGKMEYNVWNKLARRNLYTENNIRFPDGYAMGEDLTMLMLFACARKVAYAPGAFYHYVRTNPAALTQSMSESKETALRYNVLRIENYLKDKFQSVFENETACLKLNLKWPFLITSSQFCMYKKWGEWFPEANRYIKSHPASMRIRILEKCAEKHQYWVVWLHYWIVIRLFYSLAYRR